MRKNTLLFLAMLGIGYCSEAFAYKECVEHLSRYYIGDEGILWMTFADGGSAYLRQADVDFNASLTLVTAALLSNKPIIVRYDDDGAGCNEGSVRQDVRGIWLLGNE